MSKAELKPCPFCGNPAVLYQIPKEENPDFKGGNLWNVRCSNAYCLMLGNIKHAFATKEMAISQWNRRKRKNKLTFSESEVEK